MGPPLPTSGPQRALDGVLLVACVAVPGAVAAAHVPAALDGVHDEGVIRVLARGWTGAFRGLDPLLAGPFLPWPVGTALTRAGLASVLVVALAGALMFLVARTLLAAQAGGLPPSARRSFLAAVVSWTATLTMAWQLEGSAVAGAVTGGLLVLAPLGVTAVFRGASRVPGALAGACLGAALIYEPLVGGGAALSLATYLALSKASARPRRKPFFIGTLVGVGLVAVGPLVAFSSRRGGLDVGVLASWAGEGDGARGFPALRSFVVADLGIVILGAALVGAFRSLRRSSSRPLGMALLVVVVTGFGGVALGAPVGPARFGGGVLAAVAAIPLLAGSAFDWLLTAMARARATMASASATLVLLLLLAIPVRAADDAILRLAHRDLEGAALWQRATLGALPPDAVLFIDVPTVARRLAALRAVGQLPEGLLLVPLQGLSGTAGARALVAEPQLQGFVRDMVLLGRPDELALSQLASSRPVVLGYDPRWDRPLARHLVPMGLFLRYEVEPRAMSDRRMALDGSAALEGDLIKHLAAGGLGGLRNATTPLLRMRLLAFAASNDRDLLPRVENALRTLAPEDDVLREVSRRAEASKGAIDVKDLRP